MLQPELLASCSPYIPFAFTSPWPFSCWSSVENVLNDSQLPFLHAWILFLLQSSGPKAPISTNTLTFSEEVSLVFWIFIILFLHPFYISHPTSFCLTSILKYKILSNFPVFIIFTDFPSLWGRKAKSLMWLIAFYMIRSLSAVLV